MKEHSILVINPGSTSTKIALYADDKPVFTEEVRHSVEELEGYKTIRDQLPFRAEIVNRVMEKHNVALASLSAITGRGGNMKPVEGGTYRVSQKMVEDLGIGVMGQHASNLGGIIAHSLAEPYGIPAFVTDPVVVDEFEDVARLSGCPDIQRKSKDHPLNQKAAARRAACELGGAYADFNFIVAHMGGGISVGIHKKGRIIDVNNALDGDGPFSPERSGGIPFGALIDLCYSGKYTREELRKRLVGKGGLTAYLGTSDAREIVSRIRNGDDEACLVYEAMAYQIAKEIGAGSTVLKGNVDGIVLTGGLAHDTLLMGWIRERTEFISRVFVYAGEFEMDALAQGALRVLRGEETEKQY